MRYLRRNYFWLAPWALSTLTLAACSSAEFSGDASPNQRVRPATSTLVGVSPESPESVDLQKRTKPITAPGQQLEKELPALVTDAHSSLGKPVVADEVIPLSPAPAPEVPTEQELPPAPTKAEPSPPPQGDTPSANSIPVPDAPDMPAGPLVATEPPRDSPPEVSIPTPLETTIGAPPAVETPTPINDTPIVNTPAPDAGPSPSPLPPVEPGHGIALKPCSQTYSVPATSNPYLAGNTAHSSLTYRISSYDPPSPKDVAAMNSPVLVAPIGDCITAGKSIYFSVSGSITFSRVDAPTDGNGSIAQIVHHQKGATLGKSDVIAPINSLIGVFLSEQDPAGMPAPDTLDFSTQRARDYVSLSPVVGQVFFIGTGKTSTGEHHKVIVPHGATRLYFAVMDIYQWNNNAGLLSGAIMTE